MKTFSVIAKVVAALAAVAGIVYVVATYGDKIVAWAKNLLGKGCCCGDCECAGCECNDNGECTCEFECDDCECCDCECDCEDECECEECDGECCCENECECCCESECECCEEAAEEAVEATEKDFEA